MSARSMFLSLAFSLLVVGQTVAEPPPRTDRYGDPLPPGAIARLGSVRWHHPDLVGPLAFSHDGKTFAVVTGDEEKSTLWLWDVATGALRRRLRMPPISTDRIALTPDGRSVLVPVYNVQLVDLATGKVVRQFHSPVQGVSCFALSTDGKTLATGCRAGDLDKPNLIHLWDVATGAERGRLDGHRTAVTALVFSVDGQRLFSASDDYDATPAGSKTPRIIRGTVCTWDVATGKLRRRINAKGYCKGIAPDGRSLAVVSDRTIHVWDIEADKDLWRLSDVWAGDVVAFLPNGKTLAASGVKQPLALWDVATGRQVRRFQGYCPPGTSFRGLSPDGKLLATVSGSFDTGVRLWDATTGKEVRPFGGHVDRISCLAFGPDGKTLVSGSWDRTVRVWNPRTGQERRCRGHGNAITAVAFSPDGKVVASGDAAYHIHLWDPSTREQLRRLDARPARREEGAKSNRPEALRSGIRSLVFTPDGQTLIAASEAGQGEEAWFGEHGTITFWDPLTGRQRRPVMEERGCPLTISPDGTVVISLARAGGEFGTTSLQEKLLWRSLVSGKLLGQIDGAPREYFKRVVFSADGKTLLVHSRSFRPNDLFPSDLALRLFEVATRKEVLRLKEVDGTGAFSPDGRIMAFADQVHDHLIRLVESDAGASLGQLSGSLGHCACCTFSPDGTLLAAGGEQAILVWDVKAPPLNRRPAVKGATAADLDHWWMDLAGADAARAHQAIGQLAARPGQSVPLLRERLRPIPGVPAATIARHIKDLDSDDFRTREQATAALEKLGELAEPALRKALTAAPALEVRRRVEQLLARADAAVLAPEQLRAVRATTVLERAGTAEARQLLRRLAEGAAGARLTEEARASLRRLSKRPGGTGD